MKKIFLYAYDQMNLGDDLFIHTIVNRYPNVKFYLWSSAVNKVAFSSLRNLVLLDYDSLLIRIIKKIRPSFAARYKNQKEKSCNAVVYIGGSIFIEYDNWKIINTWWEYEAQNRNLYVLGANFGPYHTEAFRESFSALFAKMKDVCLRDRYSKSLFSDIATVRYAPDILFSYPLKERSTNEKQVFVSVIDCGSKDEGDNKLNDYEDAYMEIMATLLRNCIDQGYKVVLSSFCKVEGDENAVEVIRSILPVSKTEVVNYSGTNSQEVLDKISESSFIIASRFHAAVLGFAAGKPVLPIVYSDKMIHVLRDVGFAGKYLDIRHLDLINIQSLLLDADSQKLSGIETIKKQSELHFQKIDQLLKRSRNA